MSILAVQQALAADILPPAKKLVFVKFAYHCNDEGRSLFLSMQTAARAAGISRSQAQRYVRGLIADGLLSVTANAKGGKPGSVPHYWLHMDRLAAMVARDGVSATPTDSVSATRLASDQSEGSHGCDGRGSTDAMGGVAPTTQRGSAHATQYVNKGQLSVIEPSDTRAPAKTAKASTSGKPRKPVKTAIPDNFGISPRVRAWAESKGFDRLDDYLEHFIGKAKAGAYAYADWDEGFMGCIRSDWPGLRSSGGHQAKQTKSGSQSGFADKNYEGGFTA